MIRVKRGNVEVGSTRVTCPESNNRINQELPRGDGQRGMAFYDAQEPQALSNGDDLNEVYISLCDKQMTHRRRNEPSFDMRRLLPHKYHIPCVPFAPVKCLKSIRSCHFMSRFVTTCHDLLALPLKFCFH